MSKSTRTSKKKKDLERHIWKSLRGMKKRDLFERRDQLTADIVRIFDRQQEIVKKYEPFIESVVAYQNILRETIKKEAQKRKIPFDAAEHGALLLIPFLIELNNSSAKIEKWTKVMIGVTIVLIFLTAILASSVFQDLLGFLNLGF